MENKKLSYNKENISSIIAHKGPGTFKIAENALSLFNEAVPVLAEMVVHLQRGKYEFQIIQLTECLNTFSITSSAFLEFLSKNENLDFPLTQYEELKKQSLYQLIKAIQESQTLTLEEKSSELRKLWLIADESDKQKHKSDFIAMAQNYGVKAFTGSAVLLVAANCVKTIITAVKLDPTKVAVETAKTARTAIRSNFFKSLFKL